MKASGKKVLITGGSSGIGLSLAKKFIENNNQVFVTGRNQEKLEKVKAENPGLNIYKCDVTNNAEIQNLASTIQSTYGGLDVLVNNAGVYHGFNLNDESHPLEKQLMEVDIDFSGPIRMLHYFLPQLKQSEEAAVINVSSGLAFVPLTQAPVYSATKAGVHAWTQAIRLHLKPAKINVIELMPPLVDTPMVSDISGKLPKRMAPEKLAAEFWKGYLRNQKEILPGMSKQLRMMRRMAPGFIFKQLNKQAVPEAN